MASIYRKYFNPVIQSKIAHIFDTSTRLSETLGLGGCQHHVRTRWEWTYFNEFFEKNSREYTFEELIKKIESAFPNGLVVVFRNSDYFSIKEKEHKTPIEEFMYSRLGSNELLSSVILIESTISTCVGILPFISKLNEIEGLIPLTQVKYKAGKSSHMTTSELSSNCYWTGHYAVNSKGGTHKKDIKGNIPLGNPIYDYSSKYTQDSIEFHMVYMMLRVRNAHILLNDPLKIAEVTSIYENECKKRGLVDFEKFGIANPIDADGFLRCCLSRCPVDASDFLKDNTEDESIQYCHINSKSYRDVFFSNDEILTTFRPYNIGWGKRWANRSQGEQTIEEFRNKLKYASQFL